MKRIMASMLIITVLSLWVPCASAEIYQELDPMVSPDAQVIVMDEASTDAVSAADARKTEKKVEKTKKEKKSSKSLNKKEKNGKKEKTKKSSSKSSKKYKKGSAN